MRLFQAAAKLEEESGVLVMMTQASGCASVSPRTRWRGRRGARERDTRLTILTFVTTHIKGSVDQDNLSTPHPRCYHRRRITQGLETVRYSFSMRLFHPLLLAGFDRRFP